MCLRLEGVKKRSLPHSHLWAVTVLAFLPCFLYLQLYCLQSSELCCVCCVYSCTINQPWVQLSCIASL